MDLTSYFDSSNFMPHGMCYLWRPDILWTSVISDVVTALAYFSITLAVIVFVNKRKDLPYPWFFVLAGSVIFLACGFSHLINAIVIWEPIYGVSSIVKAITAVTSLATGIVIWFVLPIFLSLPSPSMLEKKNFALTESLEQLNVAQNHLVESKKMASLGNLVAGVAHEINTPIGTAITAVSHLFDTTNTLKNDISQNNLTKTQLTKFIEDLENSTALISSNLSRSADLVNSFKQVAVDQSDKHLRFYKVKKYIDEILMTINPLIKNTHYTINLECDDAIEVWGDPSDLAQIITNFVMNSLKHGFENTEQGNINIEVTYGNCGVLLNYKDSGHGISSEHLDKLYEPFFTTKRGSGNSGLGMHIVYNLVTQSLKGTIECFSEINKGTQFIIKFPSDIRA